MKKTMIIVEDDAGLGNVLKDDFIDRGLSVFLVDKVNDIPSSSFDYALVDLRLNGDSGLSAIEILLKQNSNCKILVLTGYGSIATAVEALRLGAINYLTKPVSSEDIEMALDMINLSNDTISVSKGFKRISLSQNEFEYINFVLNQNNGNISKTARELGLHRQSLQRKLKKNP